MDAEGTCRARARCARLLTLTRRRRSAHGSTASKRESPLLRRDRSACRRSSVHRLTKARCVALRREQGRCAGAIRDTQRQEKIKVLWQRAMKPGLKQGLEPKETCDMWPRDKEVQGQEHVHSRKVWHGKVSDPVCMQPLFGPRVNSTVLYQGISDGAPLDLIYVNIIVVSDRSV